MESASTHAMLMTIVLALALGVILLAVGRRTGVPGIVLLLVGGFALGPQGAGLILPESLGAGLQVVVRVAVGLILFEGGLTLDVAGFRAMGAMIRRLLTLGVAVTWGGTALAIHLIAGKPFGFSVIAASLVIVTGPTVIGPLLKRVRVTERLHGILHWEGVLIDPIGVFIALFCFEWIGLEAGESAAWAFGGRVAAGLALGAVGGFAIAEIIRRDWVPPDMLHGVTFGLAVLVFGAAESLQSEAGLLAMTVAGFIVGARGSAPLGQLRAFKAQVTDLAIGMLFLLLAARLELAQFRAFGVEGVALVAVVLFIVRPLSVALCAWRLDISWRERVFLGWVAPRGIVAASMASVLALALEGAGRVSDPRFVETFTYSVIVASVILHGSTAGLLARLLRVERPRPAGWLVVGAHAFGRAVAHFLSEHARTAAILVDTNAQAVREAQEEGLPAIQADARETALVDRYPELRQTGNLLALTDNSAMNVLVCQRWAELLPRDQLYRWAPPPAMDAAAVGSPIWSALPRPSLLSAELARGDAWLIWGGADGLPSGRNTRPLLVTGPDGVRPAPVDALVPAASLGALCLRRRTDYLLRSVHPDLVMQVTGRDRDTVLARLVERAALVVPNLQPATLLTDIVQREQRSSSSVGGGIAVPHVYVQGLSMPVSAVALAPDGLDMGAPDGQPVRVVFLLLSPWGDPEGHLATLAEVARLAASRHPRERLLAATGPEDVLAAIHDAQRQ